MVAVSVSGIAVPNEDLTGSILLPSRSTGVRLDLSAHNSSSRKIADSGSPFTDDRLAVFGQSCQIARASLVVVDFQFLEAVQLAAIDFDHVKSHR